MEPPAPLPPTTIDYASRALALGRQKEIPYPATYETLYAVVERYNLPADRLLFQWLYLTGQRVSEALAMRRSDIRLREEGGKRFMVVDSITLKNRQHSRRELAVPLFGFEATMAQPVWETIKDLRPEASLFIYSRQQAFNHLSKVSITSRFINAQTRERTEHYLAIHPHYLRHCRATHLVTEYDYDVGALMKYFGWSSSQMADLYVDSNWKYLAKKFIKKE